MFVILITYKKSLDMVDKYLAEHVDFLEACYQQNYFIVSGRKNPRTGGVIVSQLTDRGQLDAIISKDPFYVHDIADYEVIEFIPGKWHSDFSVFLKNSA